MWSDNETTLDLLGFGVHADLIRSVVTDASLLPVTIGIFGDWGGGKTSVMRMLQRDLDPENYPAGSPERSSHERMVCLYFNSWLFEGYDDAKSAILSSILVQLAEHKRLAPKVRDKAIDLLKSVNWMRLARFGFKEVAFPAALAYLTGGASLVPALAETGKKVVGLSATEEDGEDDADAQGIAWEEVFSSKAAAGPMDVRTFRARFEDMLNDADVDSLVILIDDLDRCSPQRIVDNLEAVKLFLSVDHTAFVIGADPRIVRHAVSTVYNPKQIEADAGEFQSQTDVVTDYLEKVIQIPYRLPRLSPAEVETYMSLLFCRRYLQGGSFDCVLEAAVRHKEEDRYTVFGYGAIEKSLEERPDGTLNGDLKASLAFCTAAAPLITEGLKGNPRQVKRFLNAYILRKKLAEVARLSHLQDSVLVKLMVLEYAHFERFSELYGWQASQAGMPEQLQQLEAGLDPLEGEPDYDAVAKEVAPKWATSTLRRWVAMEPHLSEVDLRDYFWVARDRLQSVLSGVTLVPPIVRRLLDGLLAEEPGGPEAAVQGAKDLSPDEVEALLELLRRTTVQHPEEENGYAALVLLANARLVGSMEALVTTLQAVAPDQIPAFVGIELDMLLKEQPESKTVLGPVIDHLAETETGVGAAITGVRTS